MSRPQRSLRKIFIKTGNCYKSLFQHVLNERHEQQPPSQDTCSCAAAKIVIFTTTAIECDMIFTSEYGQCGMEHCVPTKSTTVQKIGICI